MLNSRYVFRRAIDAIIHFATERYKSIFSSSEAAGIKSRDAVLRKDHRAVESGRHMVL